MTATTFDTLGYFEKLKAAGFTEEQAKVQAEMLREHAEAQNAAVQKILDSREKELATKTDLKELELRLLKWQFGIALALAAIMAKGFGWIGF